jgi:hypothetical protein
MKRRNIMSEELNDLCESISDKIMEIGLFTNLIEDGELATVSLRVTGKQNDWSMYIDVVVDDRESDEISEDEDENICDSLEMYFTEKGLNESFESLGYSENDRDTICVVLVE